MFVVHTRFTRISAVSGLRLTRAVTSHVSREQNQALHKGLEQMQKSPQATSTTLAEQQQAEYLIAKQRRERYNQAAINAACSFLVVLLAAQSYKAGIERRKALDHLEAATEVLKDKQERLKQLMDPVTADDIASACLPVLLRQRDNVPNRSGFWTRTVVPALPVEEDTQQQLSAIIHSKLCSVIDPTDMDEEGRDKELVRELVKTIDAPSRKQVFTI